MPLEFFVKGEPVPKQSFRSLGKKGGYTHPRVKRWQSTVTLEASRAMFEAQAKKLDGELAVRLAFQLGNNRKIDCDNLSKAVLDGLNDVCFNDDRQIVDLHILKTVTGPGDVGVWVYIEAAQ